MAKKDTPKSQRYLYIPVGGTRIKKKSFEWRNRGSEFDLIAGNNGFDRVDLDGDPTSPDIDIWSRAIGGTFVQSLWGGHRSAWRKGADSLLWAHYKCHDQEYERSRCCVDRPLESRAQRPIVWIGHSHGGTVAALALAEAYSGVPSFHWNPPAAIVSLDMPVRRGLVWAYDRIRKRYPDIPIIHIHSQGISWSTRYRWLGSRFNTERWWHATANIPVLGGHSGFLTKLKYIWQWEDLWGLIRSIINARSKTERALC